MSEQVEEVKIYLTERTINGHLYGDQICARSREEADELAGRLGGRVLGTYLGSECGFCGQTKHDGRPQLSENEWPEVLEEVP